MNNLFRNAKTLKKLGKRKKRDDKRGDIIEKILIFIIQSPKSIQLTLIRQDLKILRKTSLQLFITIVKKGYISQNYSKFEKTQKISRSINNLYIGN